MGNSVEDYKSALLKLLPPGRVFLHDRESKMPDTVHALADEYARIDQRTDNLIDEFDPRTTQELLPEWERVLAITAANSIAERRLEVAARLTEEGGQSKPYFIALAANLGYEITITEFRPASCMSAIDQPIYDESVRFVWRVNAPETNILTASCMSPCTEPLCSWGNKRLETEIRKRCHAHVTVIFAYKN